MGQKKGLQIFLVLIIAFGFFNFAYADSGPTIGANQAQKIAQNYLNSHDLPYTALTPGWDDWKAKVTVMSTGAEKWLPLSQVKGDLMEDTGKYEMVPGYNTAWVVQVNNQNGKNVGRIYVDAETGKVLKAILDQNTSDEEILEINNTSNTNQTAQDQGLLGSLIDSIVSFFQQIWIAIFGS